jgi:type IV pilus modification protein PilV
MNKTMKQKIDNSSGFTLIEVLIAALIITFGTLAMGTFLGNLISKNSSNERQTIATLIAQDKIEDLRTTALTGDLTASTTTETITTAAGPFTMTTTIDDSSNPNQITVVVDWDGQGASQFTLMTLVND